MDHTKADQVSNYFFHEGTTTTAYTYMGAHPAEKEGEEGYVFRVWAPNAASVSVVGDFNSWDREKNPMGPEECPARSNRKVWWKCSQGHSWQATPDARFQGSGCPFCRRERKRDRQEGSPFPS